MKFLLIYIIGAICTYLLFSWLIGEKDFESKKLYAGLALFWVFSLPVLFLISMVVLKIKFSKEEFE